MPFSRLALIGSVAVTVLLFAGTTIWALPHLQDAAAGLPAFDLRITGYSAAEARAYLAALSGPGREFYLNVIGWLDTVFPPLLALSLTLCFRWLAPARLAVVLSAVAVAGAVFDLFENAAIAALLRADPAAVSDAAIAVASRWTVLKWAADGLCLAALAVLLAQATWTRRAGRA